MRGFSEMVAVVLLALLALTIGTLAYALVQETVNRDVEAPNFVPPPHLLSASATVTSLGETGYLFEVNAQLASCRGIEDAQGTLVGIVGTDKIILGSSYPESCENGFALFKVVSNSLADSYKFYLWKYGYKSDEVDLTVTTSEVTVPPPG